MGIELWGRTIVASRKQTSTEQVYDILCEEIHAGRWRVGERLPSIAELAALTGLSRMPIQQAFERLEREGYARSQARVGTFLKAVFPEGRTPQGAIGVLMLVDQEHGSAERLETHHARLHNLMEEAVRRGYQVETVYRRSGDDGDRVDRVAGLFSERVRGVISLHPFAHEFHPRLPDDRLPLIFWLAPSDDHLPCVFGDHYHGMRELMRRVIAAGHRRILFFPAQTHESEARQDVYWQAFCHALRDARLPVDHEAIERLRAIPEGDLPAIRDMLGREAATAFVCDSKERLQSMVTVADLFGLRIPGDVSVVGPRVPLRAGEGAPLSTGIAYQQAVMVGACFDLLLEVIRTRVNRITRLGVAPVIREGASLGPPRAAARGEIAGSGVKS